MNCGNVKGVERVIFEKTKLKNTKIDFHSFISCSQQNDLFCGKAFLEGNQSFHHQVVRKGHHLPALDQRRDVGEHEFTVIFGIEDVRKLFSVPVIQNPFYGKTPGSRNQYAVKRFPRFTVIVLLELVVVLFHECAHFLALRTNALQLAEEF